MIRLLAWRRRFSCVLTALVLGATVAPYPVAAASDNDITITFVRHGESVSNASGTVDTAVPGPPLSTLGIQQATDVANRLSRDAPDGVFASSMLRAQQSADYLADELHESVQVLPGLSEVDAGDYQGRPASEANDFYSVMQKWLSGSLEVRIPGAESGWEFMQRYSDAVRKIYASGDQRPVAYSHGAAIAVWTLMSVSNPRFELFQDQPLPNTGYVVIQGNPTDGWRLVDWNGTKIS